MKAQDHLSLSFVFFINFFTLDVESKMAFHSPTSNYTLNIKIEINSQLKFIFIFKFTQLIFLYSYFLRIYFFIFVHD